MPPAGLTAISSGPEPTSICFPAGVTRQPCGVTDVPSGCGPDESRATTAAVADVTSATALASASRRCRRCSKRPIKDERSHPARAIILFIQSTTLPVSAFITVLLHVHVRLLQDGAISQSAAGMYVSDVPQTVWLLLAGFHSFPLVAAPANGAQPPICCMSERRLPTPQWSVILPFWTRITSTVSKEILRWVGATPRNRPSCVPW